MISISSKYQATVLIVESEASLAQSLYALLTAAGYNVILAFFGQDAIEKAKAPVDLILLDLMLSDMEGLQLCHYFKRSEVTREVPIMVLSGNGQDERLQCMRLGANDFLDKPFDGQDLLTHVEVLMHGRNGVEANISRRMERLRELKIILENNLVEPHFQPIYLLEPWGLLGVEVLSRPQTGNLLKDPQLLFEAAQEFGFYFNLEMMVWKKALEIFSASGQEHRLFLNCSPHLVEHDHFMQVQELFNQSVVESSNIFLELTERSAISEHKTFYDRLKQYRNSGFKIAVDDVGSGYSSLESIIATRPEVVKIDRHIVHGLVEDPYKSSIVKFIVSFCREHDIICVAEGVETKNELLVLKKLGVQACQGYYFCRPTPHLDVPAFRAVSA